MDLVSIDFSSVDLFVIGVAKERGGEPNFIYCFKDEEKIAFQQFLQELAENSAFKSTLQKKP